MARKRENPARTAAGVRRILRAQLGWAPDERTLCRHFARLGLMGATSENRVPDTPGAFGRFEASRPNELWTGDVLHGPVIARRKTFLFAFIDDRSRALAASVRCTVRTQRSEYAFAFGARTGGSSRLGGRRPGHRIDLMLHKWESGR